MTKPINPMEALSATIAKVNEAAAELANVPLLNLVSDSTDEVCGQFLAELLKLNSVTSILTKWDLVAECAMKIYPERIIPTNSPVKSDDKPKRVRRTKEQILADEAAKAAAKDAKSDLEDEGAMSVFDKESAE